MTDQPKGLQFCWYGWRGPWLRCFFDRFSGQGLSLVYRWRIAIGPLDIRRWLPAEERAAARDALAFASAPSGEEG